MLVPSRLTAAVSLSWCCTSKLCRRGLEIQTVDRKPETLVGLTACCLPQRASSADHRATSEHAIADRVSRLDPLPGDSACEGGDPTSSPLGARLAPPPGRLGRSVGLALVTEPAARSEQSSLLMSIPLLSFLVLDNLRLPVSEDRPWSIHCLCAPHYVQQPPRASRLSWQMPSWLEPLAKLQLSWEEGGIGRLAADMGRFEHLRGGLRSRCHWSASDVPSPDCSSLRAARWALLPVPSCATGIVTALTNAWKSRGSATPRSSA
jgi:hypothetical protein